MKKNKKLYRSIAEMNSARPLEPAANPPLSIAENGGIADFVALIKAQGEQLRANPPVIPRNHVWEDETKKGKKKSKGKA
jgi:hypothetical protein